MISKTKDEQNKTKQKQSQMVLDTIIHKQCKQILALLQTTGGKDEPNLVEIVTDITTRNSERKIT
jgi:hypothetical protein